MKKSLSKKIIIPESVEVTINENKIIIKGPKGQNSRTFDFGKVHLEKKENEILLSHKKATKNEKKIINTIVAHLKNMIRGVQEKFEYKLKICSSHFPINVKIEGNKVIIKNFLGEKVGREMIIPEGAEVTLDKEIITVTSTNREIAGQAAANFEKITKIRNKDKRVFQDGIYIINKIGRDI